jgi:AraC-like DNA-binding protein
MPPIKMHVDAVLVVRRVVLKVICGAAHSGQLVAGGRIEVSITPAGIDRAVTETCVVQSVRIICPDRNLAGDVCMGPNRYLRLRRMNLARRALIDAAPDETSVTDVAMRFRSWGLGRFASAYRILFDETPSATLRCLRGIEGATKHAVSRSNIRKMQSLPDEFA